MNRATKPELFRVGAAPQQRDQLRRPAQVGKPTCSGPTAAMKVATTWLLCRSVPTSCRQRSKSGDGDRAEVALRLRRGGEVAALQPRSDLAAVALRAGWVEVELGDGAVEVGAGFRERTAALGRSTRALICRCGVTVACGLFVVGGHQGASRGHPQRR